MLPSYLLYIVYVVEACTAINSEFVVYLIGCPQLQSEVVLLSVNVAAYTICRCRRAESLFGKQRRNKRNLAFEGGKTSIESSLSSPTYYAETHLEAPLFVVLGNLERWEDRHRRLSFKLFDTLIVAPIQSERLIERCALQCRNGHSGVDGTGLINVLHVERNVQPHWKEGYTCRIGINSIYADGAITC